MTHPTEREAQAAKIANEIVRDVCRLPDHTSQEDWPGAIIVATDDLHEIIVKHLAVHDAAAEMFAPKWLPIEFEGHDPLNGNPGLVFVPYTDGTWPILAAKFDKDLELWITPSGEGVLTHYPTHYIHPPQPPEKTDE
jgi:hypothetical protein